MKKIVSLFILFTLLTSCGEQPNCNDEEITNTVFQILEENNEILINENGNRAFIYNVSAKDSKIDNIMTTSIDNSLKICNCEGNIKIGDTIIYRGSIKYTAQKNENDDLIVKVESVSPLSKEYK
ncbi:hypothetical protein ACM55F_00220 [Flavobacterium sp. XS2P12]|uniref:hypothetical protein n=1 Tax=Flavobacterium melibiosi TaxID=3398734 RepID=UPI003A866F68